MKNSWNFGAALTILAIAHVQSVSGSLTQPHVDLKVESAIDDTRILGDTSAELDKQGQCDMRPRTSLAHLRDDPQPSSPKGLVEIAKKIGRPGKRDRSDVAGDTTTTTRQKARKKEATEGNDQTRQPAAKQVRRPEGSKIASAALARDTAGLPLQGSSTATSAKPGTKRKFNSNQGTMTTRISPVWNYFERFVEDGRLTKAICMRCKVALSARSTAGTTHLLRHVEACYKGLVKKSGVGRSLVLEDLGQNPGWQSHLDQQLSQQGLAEGSIFEGNSESEEIESDHARPSLHFDQNVSEEILAKMFIVHGYPFEMMDHSLFQEFVASIQPQFKIGDQKTLRNNCIFLYMKTRKSIMKEISSISQVALSADVWELKDMKSYMAITAHYLDSPWSLQKKIIGFKPLPSPHNGQLISEQLLKTLEEWNLIDECESITVAKTPPNDLAVSKLHQKIRLKSWKSHHAGEFHFNIPCVTHTIHSMIEEGITTISNTLYKIQDSIRYVQVTSEGRQAFKEIINHSNFKFQKPESEFLNEWKSTYHLIDLSLKYKLAFENLRKIDSHFISCPTSDEWYQLENVRNILKVFKQG
ncbi:hypothetical protein MJO28_005945 [Puccinia striiformis f. sp. tritici]|uniref:Uncharacterized protein n=1 Tax=Puccinia striiformis f. sp. tritici TaxID=168172 RepID=A0ACC0EHU9_9BASI|nr:hypothetical protein MJO28_005945 [Puccinia striiformis f. sp. tritici]